MIKIKNREIYSKLKIKKPSIKKMLVFLFILTIFIIWSLVLYHYSPQGIVSKIGIKNSYLLLGLAAFIGGTSIFLPFPYYILTMSFGAAGLNPILLGICAGIGTLLGDSTTYYLAYHGREFAPKKFSVFFINLFNKIVSKNKKCIPVFVFLYTSFLPLPDDLIMVPAGFVGYPFKKIAPFALIGKIIFNTLLAFSGLYGWNLFFG
ncbi:MAG: VTT domain-containing protein [Candidatus Nanoarchaeia archaeon]